MLTIIHHRGQLKILTQGYGCKADWPILSLERDQQYDKRLVKHCLIGLMVKHTNNLIGLMSSDVQIYKWSLHSACQRRATKVLYEIWTKEKANEAVDRCEKVSPRSGLVTIKWGPTTQRGEVRLKKI